MIILYIVGFFMWCVVSYAVISDTWFKDDDDE